jgi:phage-related protein
MTYLAFNDIKLERTTSVKTTSRVQRAQFGDGYSQVLTDGLNTDIERWNCTTGLLTNEEAYSIESYLLSTRGQAINWISPLSTKTFSRPFAFGQLKLGYTNLSALTLTGYTRPTNYTANLVTGVLTSATGASAIPDGTVVAITLTLAARNYLLDDGWTLTPETPTYARIKFGLTQVYV